MENDPSRADWLNEAYSGSCGIAEDIETLAEAACIIKSLIAIDHALSRSELEIAIQRFRAMNGNEGGTRKAIADTLHVLEEAHKRMMEAYQRGFSIRDWRLYMVEDLEGCLEDLEHHGLDVTDG